MRQLWICALSVGVLCVGCFGDPQGDPVNTIRARNRDTALYKAGKLFGHGFEGTLVATPISMWEEKPVRNRPKDVFSVEVGS